MRAYCRRRSRCAFLFFFNRLRTVSEGCAPRASMLSAIDLDRAIIAFQFRIVGADDLNEFAIARAAAVRDDDLVIGTIGGPFPA